MAEKEEQGGSKEELSLSIEESNKLRAKLGLRALDVEQPPEEKEGSSKKPVDYMAMQAEEQAAKQSKELKEKIEDMKKVRQAQKKVMSTKGLGEASDDEGDDLDASKWVLKARKKQQTAKEKLEKQLQEEEEQAIEQANQQVSLSGLKVGHEVDEFATGESVILTLADQRIVQRDRGQSSLNEDEDELVNVNMAEFNKTQKAKALAAQKKKYDATDDGEFAEDAGKVGKKMLSQYDDFELDGKRIGETKEKKAFRLGDDGNFNATKEQQQAMVRAKLQAAASGKTLVSLNPGDSFNMVSDYQTKEEVASFNKAKNVKKKLRKKPKAEKLNLEAGEDDGTDRATREDRKETKKKEAEEAQKEQRRKEGYQHALAKAHEKSEALRAESKAETNGAFQPMDMDDGAEMEMDLDEDDRELNLSLARARRALQEKKKMEALDASKLIQDRVVVKEEEEEEEKPGAGGIVFTTTAEFCRNLQGQDEKTPKSSGSGGQRYVKETEETELGKKKGKGEKWKTNEMSLEVKENGDDEEMEDDGAGHSEQQMAENEQAYASNMAAGGALEDEGLASRSISDALKLMRAKGLKKEELAGRTKDERPDPNAPEHWHDKMNAHVVPSHMKKDIEIQRLDEFGRPMTIKEAWRKLNHNFHGKKPGAKKVEKRKRQYEEEMRLKKINAGESSVEAMDKVHKLQEKSGNAHMVLAGGTNSALIHATAQLMKK